MSRTKASADPIFAKIEAHRAAVEAMNAVCDVCAELTADDPASEDANRKSTKVIDLEMKALRALLRCRPTTIAGVVALLDHLGRPHTLRGTDDGLDTVLSLAHQWSKNEDEVRTFPHVLAGALRGLIGEPSRSAIDEAGRPAIVSLWAPPLCGARS